MRSIPFIVIVPESGIRAVYTKCPNLKVLSLKGCGYVLNDHYCEQLIRVDNSLDKSVDLHEQPLPFRNVH